MLPSESAIALARALSQHHHRSVRKNWETLISEYLGLFGAALTLSSLMMAAAGTKSHPERPHSPANEYSYMTCIGEMGLGAAIAQARMPTAPSHYVRWHTRSIDAAHIAFGNACTFDEIKDRWCLIVCKRGEDCM